MVRCDAVVIGSSPLMLLVALATAAAGRSVVVVDRSEAPGGVWRTVQTSDGLDVEYACHLIEEFPKVYEYLAAASATPFAPLDVQPIRVLPNGRRVAYCSRTTLLLGAVWSAVRVVRHWLAARVGRASAADRERDIVFRQKVRDFVLHHRGLLFRGSSVQAPVAGHAEFIRSLIERCRTSGVEFVAFDVVRAVDDGRQWRLEEPGGRVIEAGEVHCTTSAMLRQEDSRTMVARQVDDIVTRSVLTKVPKDELVEAVSYAAFWDDPEVVRVSRIDRRHPIPDGLVFLVQLSHDLGDDTRGTNEIVTRALRSSGVIRADGEPEILEEIASTRVPHVHQMPAGNVARSFKTYSSAGNLASGVAKWLREESS